MLSTYHNSLLVFFMTIYGISKSSALKMCKNICFSPLVPANVVTVKAKRKAISLIKKTKKIDFDLKDEELQMFVHLYTIKHLKSFKHKFFLPINGQRNCTN